MRNTTASLQGLNKAETAAKYGDEQVLVWRRSFDVAPHALAEDDPRNPRFEDRYQEVPDAELPRTESLKDTIERIMPIEMCHLPESEDGRRIAGSGSWQ